MWLPDRLYERAPLYWLLVGMIFLGGAAFLGLEHQFSTVYLGVGVLSVIWSFCVMYMRARRRRRDAFGHPSEEAALDKTQPIQAPSDAVKAAAAAAEQAALKTD